MQYCYGIEKQIYQGGTIFTRKVNIHAIRPLFQILYSFCENILHTYQCKTCFSPNTQHLEKYHQAFS